MGAGVDSMESATGVCSILLRFSQKVQPVLMAIGSWKKGAVKETCADDCYVTEDRLCLKMLGIVI